MSDEVWGETPQEAILDCIYESVVAAAGIEWEPDLYGVTEHRPLATLHIKDPDGICWEITAKVHPH
jgi:hypothetical protein